jgi:hypothetical protein
MQQKNLETNNPTIQRPETQVFRKALNLHKFQTNLTGF